MENYSNNNNNNSNKAVSIAPCFYHQISQSQELYSKKESWQLKMFLELHEQVNIKANYIFAECSFK